MAHSRCAVESAVYLDFYLEENLSRVHLSRSTATLINAGDGNVNDLTI